MISYYKINKLMKMEKIKILLNLHFNLLMNLENNKIKNLFNGMNNFIKKHVNILNIW